ASVDKTYEAAVIFTMGDVKVDKEADGNWVPAEIGEKLKTGAIIKTGADGIAEIVFDAEGLNIVRINENTQITVEKSMIDLYDGKLYVSFENLAPGSEFKVKTPVAICGIEGSDFMAEFLRALGFFDVDAVSDEVWAQGLDERGRSTGPMTVLPQGWGVRVKKGGKVGKPAVTSQDRKRDFDAWKRVLEEERIIRERRIVEKPGEPERREGDQTEGSPFLQ
ncbi:MAG: FecR domain-containing protein, partial [Candidatus Omnitrophota bacterium]